MHNYSWISSACRAPPGRQRLSLLLSVLEMATGGNHDAIALERNEKVVHGILESLELSMRELQEETGISA